MPLNKNTIVMVENNVDHLCLHYADGHFELVEGIIDEYRLQNQKGYKNPIVIQDHYLYPTKNIKNQHCQWLNIEMVQESNHYYMLLLEYNELSHQVQKMCISIKRKEQ